MSPTPADGASGPAAEDAETAGPGLQYPFPQPPASGHALQIAEGVRWIRMPLPYALDHINLYALADGPGWALVDTGTRTEAVTEAWRVLLEREAHHGPLTRVFVTHMHPDHIGMAGWLTRQSGTRLWITRQEYLHCRVVVSDTGREAPADALAFYQRAGWSEQAIGQYRARFGNFGRHVHPLPDSYRRIVDGEEVRIGTHAWRVIVGNGHSPEHACLYCPELKLLVSGDQVLPRISSNVSVYPLEPDADPMADWLASLDKLEREVPDDVLVLPAHGECFRGLHHRLRALRRGQQRALERLRRTLTEPRRTVDTFGALFARRIQESDAGLLGLATGEAQACLNHLLHQGTVARTVDEHGVAWYRTNTGLSG